MSVHKNDERRPFRRMLLGLVILEAILLTTWIGSAWIADVDPPSVDHLAAAYAEIPAEENAFVPCQAAIATLWIPEGEVYFRKPDALLEGFEETGSAEALQVLAHNARALELLEQAMARPRFVPPVMDDHDDPIWNVIDLRNLARVVQLRIRVNQLRRNYNDAIRDCDLLLRLGHALEGDSATLITAHFGHGVKYEGLRHLVEIVTLADLAPFQLQTIREAMDRARFRPELLENVIKRTYRISESMLETAEGARGLQRFLLKPNLTRRRLVAYYDRVLAESHRPRAERTAVRAWLQSLAAESRVWTRVLRLNVYGERLLARGLPWFDHDDILYFERASDVAVALYLHRSVTGTFPDRLSELVPRYLERVPRDPFDGAPLRYSRERLEITTTSGKAEYYRVSLARRTPP